MLSTEQVAMAGGTLLCLAADSVVIDENAVLGPVDPQLGEYPASSVLKIMKQKNVKSVDDKRLILADMTQKAVDQMKAFLMMGRVRYAVFYLMGGAAAFGI